MGTAFFLIMSIASQFVGMIASNAALQSETDAAAEQARRDNEELDRQREQANEIAQEKKSDRARESDRENASMVAMLADVGGLSTINEARFSQEVGFNSGLDISRIEGNRLRQVEALRSSQVGNRQNALNIASQNRSKAVSNVFGFIGGAAKSASPLFKSTPTTSFTAGIRTGSAGAALSGGGTVGSGRLVGGV